MPQFDLNKARLKLYDAFNTYTPSRVVAGCPCCTDDKLAKILGTSKLKDLGLNELNHYASSALLTWGDLNDFKYFLPRILELYYPIAEVDLEIILSKLQYSNWNKWPKLEVEVVTFYLKAIWEDVINQLQSVDAVDEVLCAIALTGTNLNFYLESWAFNSKREARINLGKFIIRNISELVHKNELFNPFYKDIPESVAVIKHWLYKLDANILKIDKYIEDDKQKLESAINLLQLYQRK
ncbi:hypothetical protein BVY03_01680 [bacterium K02(2017)]|nr:hypothetical protein BVY03_01680 [bacterium K02(2017)]